MPSLLRRARPVLIVVVVAFAIYDAPIFYSRWRSARKQARSAEAAQAEEARRTLALLGNGKLKILNFYGPNAIRRGEQATICYGVDGAKSVRIEPPVEKLQPAVSHCLQVSPSATTEYKLIAEDGSGHSATSQLTVQVGP